ncbi:unnamed protein product [Amaranthus hypochondriacus]
MQKTKKIFLKTLQNLKNFLFRTYETIPKTLSLNPLCCTKITQRNHHLDHIYPESSNSHQSPLSDHTHDQDNAKPITKIHTEKTVKNAVPPRKNKQSDSDAGVYLLEQQMKDLEMMDVGDVDHVSDVKEALHCYSLLTSPVYVEMVNKFFMDMYTDFNSVPQPGISKCSSSRRLHPLSRQPSTRIGSSRRLGHLTPQPSIRVSSSSRRLGSFTLCLE